MLVGVLAHEMAGDFLAFKALKFVNLSFVWGLLKVTATQY